jgi:adenylate kinase family enzyme
LKRVNVKGTSGSGKTTFAQELARRLELPFVELDALHHGPDWYQPSAEEFSATVREAIDDMPDGWVIDGNYESKLGELVLGQADTIVWLDLPFALKLRRLLRRTISRIRRDVELWSGNKESWRGAFWGRLAALVDGEDALPAQAPVARALRRRPALRAAALGPRGERMARWRRLIATTCSCSAAVRPVARSREG